MSLADHSTIISVGIYGAYPLESQRSIERVELCRDIYSMTRCQTFVAVILEGIAEFDASRLRLAGRLSFVIIVFHVVDEVRESSQFNSSVYFDGFWNYSCCEWIMDLLKFIL